MKKKKSVHIGLKNERERLRSKDQKLALDLVEARRKLTEREIGTFITAPKPPELKASASVLVPKYEVRILF